MGFWRFILQNGGFDRQTSYFALTLFFVGGVGGFPEGGTSAERSWHESFLFESRTSVSRRGEVSKCEQRKQTQTQILTNASKRRGKNASKREQTWTNANKRLHPPSKFIVFFFTPPLSNPFRLFSRRMLRYFARKFWASILWVRKNPTKFPPNFPQNLPPKNQKNQRAANGGSDPSWFEFGVFWGALKTPNPTTTYLTPHLRPQNWKKSPTSFCRSAGRTLLNCFALTSFRLRLHLDVNNFEFLCVCHGNPGGRFGYFYIFLLGGEKGEVRGDREGGCYWKSHEGVGLPGGGEGARGPGECLQGFGGGGG